MPGGGCNHFIVTEHWAAQGHIIALVGCLSPYKCRRARPCYYWDQACIITKKAQFRCLMPRYRKTLNSPPQADKEVNTEYSS